MAQDRTPAATNPHLSDEDSEVLRRGEREPGQLRPEPAPQFLLLHHSWDPGPIREEGAHEDGAASRKGDPGSEHCGCRRLAPGPTTLTAPGLTLSPAPAGERRGGAERGLASGKLARVTGIGTRPQA